MRHTAIAKVVLFGLVLAGGIAVADLRSSSGSSPPGSAPRAVTVARATEIVDCTSFVDAAVAGRGDGTAQRPHKTIAAALAAAGNGAVICVAEGTYAEQLKPGEKFFTLAGGFQRGKDFKVRDSAAYVTKASGRGGSFIRIEDPGPKGNQRTVIDGFDISGYSQAIFRDYYELQRFDITNNHIHDNKCANDEMAGAGFALNNVSGRIEGNVFRNNSCGRGGAGFLNDTTKENTVTIERNLIDRNAGTEPGASHGGALYVFGKTLKITGNLFTRNTVTQWGAGLYVGAWTEGGQFTTANLNWNVYRDNRAGNGGGGMFCDDGATCASYHEVYDRNCGGNIFLDSGSDGSGPTTARFDHLTNVGALDVGCGGPGPGVRIDKGNNAADAYSFVERDLLGQCAGPRFHRQLRQSLLQSADQRLAFDGADQICQPRPDRQVRRRDRGPRGSAVCRPGKRRFSSEIDGGALDPNGLHQDSVMSPAIAKGHSGGGDNPARAGERNELGAYGNSGEASYVR